MVHILSSQKQHRKLAKSFPARTSCTHQPEYRPPNVKFTVLKQCLLLFKFIIVGGWCSTFLKCFSFVIVKYLSICTNLKPDSWLVWQVFRPKINLDTKHFCFLCILIEMLLFRKNEWQLKKQNEKKIKHFSWIAVLENQKLYIKKDI